MNPYASFLGNRDPLEVIPETPGKLAHVVKILGPAGLERSYSPGKWSGRLILCHLADTEIAFAFRLRQALAEPHHVIQPFDQDAWSSIYSSPALTAESALETFSAIRRWNVLLVRNTPRADFAKPVRHPERGEMLFKDVVETIAGHDLNHLQQFEQIVSVAA
jgi:DinB family protein